MARVATVCSLCLFHRVAQSDKQQRAWVAPRRGLAYQLSRVDVCRCRPGALVSDERTLPGMSHFTDLSS